MNEITVVRLDGSTKEQVPVTPEDENKTCWELITEKLAIDLKKDDTVFICDNRDVKDELAKNFIGKKISINMKAYKGGS